MESLNRKVTAIQQLQAQKGFSKGRCRNSKQKESQSIDYRNIETVTEPSVFPGTIWSLFCIHFDFELETS